MPEVPLILDIQARDNASDAIRKVGTSTRDLITGFSGLAVSAFSVYQSFDRYQDMAVSVSRANLAVKTSQNSVEDTQRRLNATIEKYGATSEQAKAAQDDLTLAQERNTVAVERAEMIQENQNEALASMAIMIVPTAITMVDSLSKVWKNFPDMTGFLTTLNTKVFTVGLTAQTAALGVGAFVGGFLIGYTAITQFGDALGPIGRALLVIIPIIIAAAAAVWALQSGWTVGLALVALAATGVAVGAMVAQLQSVPKLAKGGTATRSTLALVGEEGPELMRLNSGDSIIPLNQTSIGARTITFNIYETENPKATADAVLDAMRRTGTA